MTVQDLKLLYKRETRKYPEDLKAWSKWLESKLIECENLKKKLIPFEDGLHK